MNELFAFLEEASFSEWEILQERSVLVCNAAGEMLSGSEGKGWSWKFRRMLYRLEQHFLKMGSREILLS